MMMALVEQIDITPFAIVCMEGHVEVVKVLMADPRVDINKSGTVSD